MAYILIPPNKFYKLGQKPQARADFISYGCKKLVWVTRKCETPLKGGRLGIGWLTIKIPTRCPVNLFLKI